MRGDPGPGAGQGVQPAFAGIATFLRAPQARVAAIPAGTVAVSGIPLDGFADTPGPAQGPRGIREASVAFVASRLPSMRGVLVDVDTGRRLELGAELPLVDTGDLDTLAGPEPLADRLAAHATRVAERASLPVFLGGTRAVTAPLLAGVARGTGRRVALLRLGATPDLADEPPDRPLWPGASLLSAARMATGTACLGPYGLAPALEWRRGRDGDGVVTSLAAWRAAGLTTLARARAEALLGHADRLYLSIDIRVADAGHAAGRGHVVSGGLLPLELVEVIEALSGLPLAAIDVVEVAPPIDSTRRAEHLALRTLLELLAPYLGAGKASAA